MELRRKLADAAFSNMPGLVTFKHYERKWLGEDLMAGLTVTAYMIPQVVAYAVLAHLGAIHALWAMIPSLIVYALLGTSRVMSVGPESTTALMTGTILAPLVASDPQHAPAMAAALALMVGVWALIARVAKLGVLADLLSQPILVGYMAGVALTMITGQLGKLTGTSVKGDLPYQQVSSFLNEIGNIKTPTLILGVSVLALLFTIAKIWPKAPAALIAVMAATAAVAVAGLDAKGITVVGGVPGGLPMPVIPDVTLADLKSMMVPAIGLLLIAYSDNMLTARAFAGRGEKVDPGQELTALAGVSFAAGVFSGFPVSSSGSRTALARASRAHTQLHSLVSALLLVVVLLFAGGILEKFPLAALGAVVIYAATKLVAVGEFRRLLAFRRSEAILAVLTFLATVALGILPGIGVAVAISVVELLMRVARPHDSVLGLVPGLPGMHDVDDYPHAERIEGLLVYRYDSPLFFANAEDFYRRALAALEEEQSNGPVHWFVFNAEASVEVDITGIDALNRLVQELHARDVVFAMARVKKDLEVMLESGGVFETVDRERTYPTLPTAVAAFRDWKGLEA